MSLDMSMREEKEEVKTRTAFLPLDEVVRVYMSGCTTPSQFYLHRVAFVDTLVRLEKDIPDWVEEKRTASYNFKPKKGEIVLVKCVERHPLSGPGGSRQMEEEDSEPRVEEIVRVSLEDQLGSVPVPHQSLAKTQAIPVTPTIPIKLSSVCLATLDSDSDSNPGQPESGFFFSYLGQVDTAGRYGKRYHHLTGEEILPETMWMSREEEGAWVYL